MAMIRTYVGIERSAMRGDPVIPDRDIPRGPAIIHMMLTKGCLSEGNSTW